jgi:hypothetical protein
MPTRAIYESLYKYSGRSAETDFESGKSMTKWVILPALEPETALDGYFSCL